MWDCTSFFLYAMQFIRDFLRTLDRRDNDCTGMMQVPKVSKSFLDEKLLLFLKGKWQPNNSIFHVFICAYVYRLLEEPLKA